MSSLLLGEHRGYLTDTARLRAFERAIQQLVSPSDSVLDLGSGTGVLGLLALRAGARHVYAVDGSPMASVARSVLRANGFADRVTVLQQHSLQVELPERVDVVVADQLGAFGLEAGVFEAFADAVGRHLRPGGTLLPDRIDLGLAAVEWPERWAEVSFWDAGPDGIDLRPVSSLARNVRYYGTCEPAQLLGRAATVAELDPAAPDALPVDGAAELTIERAGTLHGLAGWFTARLAPGITITNAPGDPERLQRSHVFLPVGEPVPVVPGTTVTATVHADPGAKFHRWTVEVRDPGGATVARSSHSTLEGTPVSREELARTRPDAVPRLTSKGEAHRTVLSLCDGVRTRTEVEVAVAERHPELFPDPGAAAGFVAQVLAAEAL